jgi:hypothetical protein
VQIKAIDTQISSNGYINDINSSVASANDSISIKTDQHDANAQSQEAADKTKKQNVLCLICNPSRYRIIFNILLHRKRKKQLKNTK